MERKIRVILILLFAVLGRVDRASAQWVGAESTPGTPSEFRIGRLPKVEPLAFSEEKTVESRLGFLEEAYAKQQADAAKKKADGAKKPSIKVTGRIHADFWGFPKSSPVVGWFENPPSTPPATIDGTDPEDRWAFRRLRIAWQGNAFDTMVYKMEVDFNNPGTPEYKDNYLGWTELPFNQSVLIGNQKRPIGLDHLNSSRYNVFMERPLVVEAFNEDARRVGICAYGYTDDEVYNWRYGAYFLENTSTDGRSIGDSLQMSGNVRLASSPWYDDSSGGRGYFHWAVAGMFARPDGNATAADTNANDGRFRTRGENRSDSRWIDTGRIAGINTYEILGLESILNVGPLQVVGEYQFNWAQRTGATDLYFHGAYIYASYFLTGEHQPYDRQRGILGRVKPFENFFLVRTCDGGRAHGLGALQIAARYSYLDITDENVFGGVENNFTVALNWFWNAHAKVQFNYIIGDIRNRSVPVGGVTGITAGNFHAYGTRFMIDF